jgi:hypothetical protein
MYYYLHKVSSETYILNFVYLSSITVLYIYVSDDVRFRGCFSKRKGVCEQESLGNSDLYYWITHSDMRVPKHTMNEHGWVDAVSRINEIKATVRLTD